MPVLQDKFRIAQCDVCRDSIHAEALFSVDNSNIVYCKTCHEERYGVRLWSETLEEQADREVLGASV